MAATLTLSIANRIAELPRLEAAVSEFLGKARVSREAIDTVELTLDELVANLIYWGHDDQDKHEIRVATTVEPAHVRITIEDDGRPFDPMTLPPPDVLRPMEDRSEGGLGVYLIGTLVDELHYDHHDGRNRLEIKVAKNQLRLCPPTSLLLLVDVVRPYADGEDQTLLPYARCMAQQVAVLKEQAVAAGVPVVYLNQSDNRWKPSFSRQVHERLRADDESTAVVRRLQPGADDVFMLREGAESLPDSFHRLLAKLRTTTLIVAGLAESICALVAANDMLFAGDLQLLVPRDCLAADSAASRRTALEQIGHYVDVDTRASNRLIFARGA
jgi:serine/threonine-protein kinase RsbW